MLRTAKPGYGVQLHFAKKERSHRSSLGGRVAKKEREGWETRVELGQLKQGRVRWFNPQMDLDRKGEEVEGKSKKKVPGEGCA